MSVSIEFAPYPSHVLEEFFEARLRAEGLRDKAYARTLDSLLFDFIREQLASKRPGALEAYLSSRKVWRSHGPYDVFKGGPGPYVAFCAFQDDVGATGVMVLGFCSDYPVSEQSWWTDVILPRLEASL